MIKNFTKKQGEVNKNDIKSISEKFSNKMHLISKKKMYNSKKLKEINANLLTIDKFSLKFEENIYFKNNNERFQFAINYHKKARFSLKFDKNKSITYFEKALEANKISSYKNLDLKNYSLVINLSNSILNDLGNIHLVLKNYKKALHFSDLVLINDILNEKAYIIKISTLNSMNCVENAIIFKKEALNILTKNNCKISNFLRKTNKICDFPEKNYSKFNVYKLENQKNNSLKRRKQLFLKLIFYFLLFILGRIIIFNYLFKNYSLTKKFLKILIAFWKFFKKLLLKFK